MKKISVQAKRLLLLAVLGMLFVTAGLGAGGYAIPRWSVDGGVGRSSSAEYTLSGGIGQPDVGVLQGGDYTFGWRHCTVSRRRG
jgi:hypothetical protein